MCTKASSCQLLGALCPDQMTSLCATRWTGPSQLKWYLFQRMASGMGFTPREPAHFGDGGAFPEIHSIQYPRCFDRDRLNTGPLPDKANGAEAAHLVSVTGEIETIIDAGSQRLSTPQVFRHAEMTRDPLHVRHSFSSFRR